MTDIDFIKWMCEKAEGFKAMPERDGYVWFRVPHGPKPSKYTRRDKPLDHYFITW